MKITSYFFSYNYASVNDRLFMKTNKLTEMGVEKLYGATIFFCLYEAFCCVLFSVAHEWNLITYTGY